MKRSPNPSTITFLIIPMPIIQCIKIHTNRILRSGLHYYNNYNIDIAITDILTIFIVLIIYYVIIPQ